MSRKVQELVTRRIVDLIEQNADLAWQRPWVTVAHKGINSQKP